MKNLKFRAWCNGDSFNEIGMYGPFELSDIESGREEANVYCENNKIWQEPDFENADIMQFTGLHDKNGYEIYEGDIVKAHENYGGFSNDFIGQIRYEKKDVSFILDIGNGEWYDFSAFGGEYEYIEIIGNIYENKDLL